MTTTIESPRRGTQLDSRDLPEEAQYSWAKILGIWAASALPMGIAFWWLMPHVIAPRMETPGIGWLLLATGGLLWQALLAFLLLRREATSFTWAEVSRLAWLHKPRSPRSGRESWAFLWWGVLVAALYAGLGATGALQPLNDRLVDTFPGLAAPDYGLIESLVVPEIVGQWWLMGVVLVLVLCNYLIGEELIFRGILLPRMRGAFGRWDVLANGILFATYHLHLIWEVPAMLVTDWLYAYLTKRYRSYWVGAIFHGIDALWVLALFPLAIAGVLQG